MPSGRNSGPVGGGSRAALALYFSTSSGLAWMGRVHRVMREVEQERLPAGARDELQRLVGQPVGQVLALRPVGQVGNAVGAEVGRRGASVAAADVQVESLVLG